MESVKIIINKFSFFIALLAFLTALISGISIGTALLRSTLVYLFTLLIIIIAIRILKWNFLNSSGEPAVNNEKNSKE